MTVKKLLRLLYDAFGVELRSLDELLIKNPDIFDDPDTLGAFNRKDNCIYLKKETNMYTAIHELAHYLHYNNFSDDFDFMTNYYLEVVANASTIKVMTRLTKNGVPIINLIDPAIKKVVQETISVYKHVKELDMKDVKMVQNRITFISKMIYTKLVQIITTA